MDEKPKQDVYRHTGYVDGCRDKNGKHDDESAKWYDVRNGVNYFRFDGRCPCDQCERRRVRKAEARRLEEDRLQARWDARRNRAVAAGVSFLLPTIRQRAWSFMKALLFGGACVAAVEIAKAVTQ